MTEPLNTEKTSISKNWKIFLIISCVLYLAAMVYVGFFTTDTVNASGLSKMSLILGGSITTFVVLQKKRNQKW